MKQKIYHMIPHSATVTLQTIQLNIYVWEHAYIYYILWTNSKTVWVATEYCIWKPYQSIVSEVSFQKSIKYWCPQTHLEDMSTCFKLITYIVLNPNILRMLFHSRSHNWNLKFVISQNWSISSIKKELRLISQLYKFPKLSANECCNECSEFIKRNKTN